MESWSYVSHEKGFGSDESISAPDVFGRGKNGLIGKELKSPYSFESSLFVTSEEGIENQGFVEFNFPEMMRKSWSSERISTPISSVTNAFSGESNNRDSSLIDLKLGRIADQRDAQDFRSSKAAPMVTSVGSSMPIKRVRTGSNSQTPFCIVFGCKKDLSSCKDYHKRHKVCEIHSKTAKVVVNGIEQRFCQQCSRFHLLAEFDDGKRSCRKRLAGHNERRRKPHVGIHPGRTGRLYQSYNGSNFQGNTLPTSSFICQDILPSNLLHQQTHDTNDWNGRIKLENEVSYSSQPALPIANGHLHPKSFFPPSFERHCPTFHSNGVNSATGREFNGISSNQYPHDLVGPDSVSGSLVHNTSIGSEDFNLFDSSSTVQGRALSLLSSQSQNSSSHTSVIPMAQPLLGVNRSNKVNFSAMGYAGGNHFSPILIPDDGDAVNFADGIFQGSQYVNGRDHLSCEDGPTIDLLQLSSQLQRVEHQKQSMQVKQG